MFRRYAVLAVLSAFGIAAADASACHWFRKSSSCQPAAVVAADPCPCVDATAVVATPVVTTDPATTDPATTTPTAAEPTADEMKMYETLKKDNQFNDGGKQMTPEASMEFWKTSTPEARKKYYDDATKNATPAVAAPTAAEMTMYEALKKDNQFNDGGKQMTPEASMEFWKTSTPEARKKYYDDATKK